MKPGSFVLLLRSPALTAGIALAGSAIFLGALQAQTIFTHDATGNRAGQAAVSAGAPPTLLVPPTIPMIAQGGIARFYVIAGGPGPFTYQWFRDGAPISGATGDTLVFATVFSDFTFGPGGTPRYSVAVTNAYGTTTSNAVELYEDNIGKGLPDWWRYQYFNTTGPVDPLGDADGDGISNIQEYRDGTGPNVGGAGAHFGRLILNGPADLLSAQPTRPTYPEGAVVSVSAASVGEMQFGAFMGNSNFTASNPLTVTFTAFGSEVRNITLTALYGSMPLGETASPPAFTFASGNSASVSGFASTPDGKSIVFGSFDRVNGSVRTYVARLLPGGALDSAFAPTLDNIVSAAAILPDGKIVIAGSFSKVNGQNRPGVARFNANGTLDTTFLPADQGTNRSGISALAVQRDGKILLGGSVWAGSGFKRLLRLNPDGSQDTAFTTTPDATVSSLGLQPDGKILLGGGFTQVDGTATPKLVRLKNDGTLDSTFDLNVTNGVNSAPRITLVQPDGRILVGGAISIRVNGTLVSLPVVRLNANGTLDTAFAQRIQSLGTNISFKGLALQEDGRIVGVGSFNFGTYFDAIRLNSDGSPDPTGFAITRPNNEVTAVVTQSDGNMLFGGMFITVGPTTSLTSTRLGYARVVTTNHILPGTLAASPAGPIFATNAPVTLSFSPQATAGNSALAYTLLESSSDGVTFQSLGTYGNANGSGAYTFPISALPPGTNFYRALVVNSTREQARTYAVGPLTTPPAVTSPLTVNIPVGTALSYQGTATGLLTAFAVSGLPGWATGGYDANTGILAITGTPTVPGASIVTLTPSNAAGSTPTTLTLNVLNTFANWRTTNFTTAEQGNSAISGPLGDATGAGIANLIKYALGIPPTQLGVSGLPTVSTPSYSGTKYLTLTYTRDKFAAGVTLTVQVGGDLVAWNSGTAYTTEVSRTDNGNGTETVVTRDNVPSTSASKRFIRLSMTQ